MSNFACILVKNIRMYRIWCILFLFAIYMVDENNIASFFITVKDNDNR